MFFLTIACVIALVGALAPVVGSTGTVLLIVFSPSLFILVRLVATAIDLAVEPVVARVLGRWADAVGPRRPA
jgi:hypothetical protein